MTKMNTIFSVSRCALVTAMMQPRHDDRGSTVPIYAVGLLLLATASAATISVNRRNLVEAATQGAADSAALAATNVYADLISKKATNQLSEQQIETKAKAAAQAMFKLNASGSGMAIENSDIDVTTARDNDGKIKSVTTRVKPTGDVPIFMAGFLSDAFKLKSSVTAEAKIGIGSGSSAYTTEDESLRRNLEVVLVLDITGSMGSTIPGDSKTKIEGLKTAVKSFVSGIYGADFGDTEIPPANIKFGIIPYSNSVNVGKLLTNTELDIPADLTNWTARTDSKGWRGCIVERSTTPNLVALDPVGGIYVRPDALDVRDASQAVTPEKWTPYYNAPSEYYQMYMKSVTTGSGKNKVTTEKLVGTRSVENWFRPSDFSSTRAPLRLVRNSVAEYWHDDTVAPTATQALDSNGNVAPRLTAATAATGGGSPNTGCVAPALPLASGYTKKRLGDYVDALSVGGWTHSNIGMAWANRMLSPWAPLAGAKNYGDAKTDKLIVLMTDGFITAGDIYSNTNSATSTTASNLLTASAVQNPAGFFRVDDSTNYDGKQMSWAGYYYAYGKSYLNRLVGTQTDGKPNSNASGHILAHQQRLLMACKIARTPEGYVGTDPATKVYTILFGFSLPEGARNIYEECATVPGYALTASNSSKLTEAFAKIADQSKLQLTE
jgi:hypothetical protein